MKKRNLMAILLCGIMILQILCTGIFAYGDEGDDADVSDDGNSSYFSPGVEIDPRPSLKMSGEGIFSFKQGETRDIDISIKNVSSFYAYNILVQPVASGENIPYEIEILDKSNTKYFLQNTVSMKLKLRIKADNDAKTGVYPLALNYSYNASDKNGFTGSDTIYIKISGESETASATLKNFTRSQDNVKPSEKIKIGATLVNEGSSDLKNVTVTLNGFENEDLKPEGVSTYNFSVLKKGESKDVSFTLAAIKGAKAASCAFNYKLTYNNAEDKESEKEFGYYVNITEEESSGERADLTVVASEPSGTYGVGDRFSVSLKVKNSGEHKADNIVITAGGDKDGAVVPRSTSVKSIKSLNPGEEKSLVFDFAPTSAAATQNYAVSFEVEYETGEKTAEGYETRKFTQYSGVNVYNPNKKTTDGEKSDEEKKTSAPKIIISRYECNPVIVEAGKTFDVSMTFENTHSLKTVKNVKLYLTVDDEKEDKGNVFTPDNSSNTYYIDEIKPKGQVSHTFSMFAIPSADARTYTVNVNFEYEDAEYNEYKTTELVGINVKQKAELTTNDIIVPTDGFAGEPINVMFELYNTGKVTLSNVMVKIVGEGFDTTSATYYAGTIEAGAGDSYDGTIIPMNVGTASGKVIITYEDTTGEKHEKVQEFTVNAGEAVPMEDYPEGEEMPVEEEQKSRLPLLIGIGAAVLVVAAIIGIVIRIKIKKRRERELSEEY